MINKCTVDLLLCEFFFFFVRTLFTEKQIIFRFDGFGVVVAAVVAQPNLPTLNPKVVRIFYPPVRVFIV